MIGGVNGPEWDKALSILWLWEIWKIAQFFDHFVNTLRPK